MSGGVKLPNTFLSLFWLLFAEVLLLQLCTYTEGWPPSISVGGEARGVKRGNLSTGINNRKFGCKLKFTGKVLRCIANLKVLPQVLGRKFAQVRSACTRSGKLIAIVEIRYDDGWHFYLQQDRRRRRRPRWGAIFE